MLNDAPETLYVLLVVGAFVIGSVVDQAGAQSVDQVVAHRGGAARAA